MKMTARREKRHIETLLQGENWADHFTGATAATARRTLNALFGLLYHREPLIRWRAITAIGMVTATLADGDMNGARVFVRRLMWQLNDESGGIGWGAPEAIGEITARHETLAQEYAAILLSYLAPWGNYLEHEPLQHGVLWAVGRLGRSRPHMVTSAGDLLAPHLTSPNPVNRGLGAWASSPIGDWELVPLLQKLTHDDAEFILYQENRLTTITVASAAQEALGRQFSAE